MPTAPGIAPPGGSIDTMKRPGGDVEADALKDPRIKAQIAASDKAIDDASAAADKTLKEASKKLNTPEITPEMQQQLDAMAALQLKNKMLRLQTDNATLAKNLRATLEELPGTANDGVDAKVKKEVDKLRQELQAQIAAQRPTGAAGVDRRPGGGGMTSTPVVSELTGVGSAYRATLLIPGYGEVMARQGTLLPNGWTVADIQSDKVVAKTAAGAKVLLPFSAVASNGNTGMASAGMMPNFMAQQGIRK